METDPAYREMVFATLRARGYKNAGSSKSDLQFRGSTGSADQQLLGSLPALRNRSIELNMDDPVASGLTTTFINNSIGRGIKPQANTGKDKKDDLLESIWNSRMHDLFPAEGINIWDGQRTAMRKYLEDGEIFIKPSKLPDRPLFFELIEADRVATPNDRTHETNITAGIEKDKYGIPVAYWVSKKHPGDRKTFISLADQFERVPADSILHFKKPSRPGSTRGEPLFHAILQDLHDMNYLLVVSLKRTQMAANFATFIKTTEKIEDFFEGTAEEYGFRLDHDIVPGMIFKLNPNESIENVVPNFPSPEFAPFVVMLARRIGAALGVSWQIVLKDFSDSTYSSARTDLLEARQTYVYLQSKFIQDVCSYMWFWVMNDARISGQLSKQYITDADIANVVWIAPGWQWVDPVKEAKGAEIELAIGITTQRELCAQKGKDWKETIEQRIKEEAFEKELRVKYGVEKEVKPDNPADDTEDEEEEKKTRRYSLIDNNGRFLNAK